MQTTNNYFQDFAIAELPQPIKDVIQSAKTPWLNSIGFCTVYGDNPAQRVLVSLENNELKHCIFYSIKKKLGIRCVEIKGFPKICDVSLNHLINLHKVKLTILNKLEEPVNSNEEWQSPNSTTYLKSYITLADLPNSKEEYMMKLGKNKHQQLPKYWRRLERHFDESFEIRCESKNQINIEDVIQLECLNKQRRASKGKGVDSIQDIRERQLHHLPLIQESGLLVTFRYHSNIIGGSLLFFNGNEAIFNILAHDPNPEFEYLRIGTLVAWKTIDLLIEKGITQLNFLWGRYFYKTQFLGVEHPWSIHIISKHHWLAVLWKHYISINELYIRGTRFLKTRLRKLFE